MVQQLKPQVRYGKDTAKTNDGCISAGMDQGFHNWLLYSGQLAKYVDLKLFQQGEGPVNTVGAFFGEHILVKFPLTDWGVMKGAKGSQIIHNWNGDPSPVVHQADRYLNTQIEPRYANLLVGTKVKALIQDADFDKNYRDTKL